MQRIWRFGLFLMIAFSFGGFTFYAAIVVPIGSDVFDSTSQGFVTQRVTVVLNVASLLTWIGLVLDAWANRKFGTASEAGGASHRKQNLWLIILLVGYAGCLAALFILHPQLDQLIDADEQIVNEAGRFYFLHRIYLWVSTFQWLTTLALVWSLMGNQSKTKVQNI